MQPVIIEPRTKSDARLLLSFSKRIGAKVIDSETLEDFFMGARMKEVSQNAAFISNEELDETFERLISGR